MTKDDVSMLSIKHLIILTETKVFVFLAFNNQKSYEVVTVLLWLRLMIYAVRYLHVNNCRQSLSVERILQTDNKRRTSNPVLKSASFDLFIDGLLLRFARGPQETQTPRLNFPISRERCGHRGRGAGG